MAKKQVLQIKDFSGGVNSYSDPRDLKENEFQILDNAVVDEQGIIRVSGALELKDNIDLVDNYQGGSLGDMIPSPGKGLFSYKTDYFSAISTINAYLEKISTSEAWGIESDAGSGAWEFQTDVSNTNNNNLSYFNIANSFMAINYNTYAANTSYDLGKLKISNMRLETGKMYHIYLNVTHEKPWHYLGSNMPPRIRLYNEDLGKYLTPDGFSDDSDETHVAKISTAQGNLSDDASFWAAKGTNSIERVALNTTTPISGSASHPSYNGFFGTTASSGATDKAAYLKVVSTENSEDPFHNNNSAISDAITVEIGKTYLLDCFYQRNDSTYADILGVRIINADTGNIFGFTNGTGYASGFQNTSEEYSILGLDNNKNWKHINTNFTHIGGFGYGPQSLEFVPEHTSIKIQVGVNTNASGNAEAYFTGFNLRKKTYELQYCNEVSSPVDSPVSIFPFFDLPNSWGNVASNSVFISRGHLDEAFRHIRKYKLTFSIPQNFITNQSWNLEFNAGKWGGINQTGVSNMIVEQFKVVDDATNLTIDSANSETVSGNSIIIQERGKNLDSNKTFLYSYQPFSKEYIKSNLVFPSNTNSVFNFIKGSKDVYFCDENFDDKNLYSLVNNIENNELEVRVVNFSGPNEAQSNNGLSDGINSSRFFDVIKYYAEWFAGHAGGAESGNNTNKIYMQKNSTTFNQYSGNSLTPINNLAATGSGSGLPSGTSGFLYDTDAGFADTSSPFTKYIVIRNDDIYSTDATDIDKLENNKRLAMVQFQISHTMYVPSTDASDFVDHYVPDLTIYLDTVSTGASDMNSSGTGHAAPGTTHYGTEIGRVSLNPSNWSIRQVGATQDAIQWYSISNYSTWDTLSNATGFSGADFDGTTNKFLPYYSQIYLNTDIFMAIPYDTLDESGDPILVNSSSSGTNLQLRICPKIDISQDMWHKEANLISTPSDDNYYAIQGIISDKWNIQQIKMFAYGENTTTTQNSMNNAFFTQDDFYLYVGFGVPDTGEADGWDAIWSFYMTTVDKNNIESALSHKLVQMENDDITKCPNIGVNAYSNNTNLTNKKFIKIYATSSRNSMYTLQAIIDCEKRTIKSSTSQMENPISTSFPYSQLYIPASQLLIPNEIDTYESETGVLAEDGINSNNLTALFKTAVLANNTMYAGNVYQNGVHYPDRMIKSPLGKVPLLPASNFIDVALNDGDEIISLQFYKDKILQFKKSKLYIINVSEDYEYLEDTIENVGISKDSQVTKTPYGIAWINSRGCYLYDGQSVNNLIENKIAYKSWKDSESSWEIDEKYGPIISYLSKEDKLIIYGATESLQNIEEHEGLNYAFPAGSHILDYSFNKQYLRQLGYQYDFKSKSWINITSFLENIDGDYNTINEKDGRLRVAPPNNMITNFSYDENGDSIFLMKPLNSILKWDDNPKHTTGELDLLGFDDNTIPNHVNRDFRIITKDYDFGEPSIKKKIYKVYVTFKSTHIESTKLKKVMQKQDLYESSNVGVYYAINGTNTWTEFSETKSDNYGTKGLISTDSETTTTTTASYQASVGEGNINTIEVASASNIKVGYVLKVNEEQMLVKSIGGVGVNGGTNITVDRNYNLRNQATGSPNFTWGIGATVAISTGDWITAELKPDSSINKIESFKLKFETKKRATFTSQSTKDANGVPSGFMINDISVIYRTKNVR